MMNCDSIVLSSLVKLGIKCCYIFIGRAILVIAFLYKKYRTFAPKICQL